MVVGSSATTGPLKKEAWKTKKEKMANKYANWLHKMATTAWPAKKEA